MKEHRDTAPSRALRERALTEPDALIVRYGADDIRAGELNALADAVAWALWERLGPGPHTVAYVGNDIKSAMVSQMAIDRAGMTAVGIPYDETPERFRAIVDNAQCRLLLVNQPLDQFPFIEQVTCWGHADQQGPPPVKSYPEAVDILFTSGSTGTPKGLSFSRYFHEHIDLEVFDFDEQVRGRTVAGLSSADIATLRAAIKRGNYHYFDFRGRGIQELAPWIRAAGITRFEGTPTLIRMLCDAQPQPSDLAGLRVLRLVGEAFTYDDVEKLRQFFPSHLTILQGYGSTDAGYIGQSKVMLSEPAQSGPIPITKLFRDVHVDLIDEEGRDVAIGEIGEVTIRSPYIPLGYLNRPDLDAEFRELLPSGDIRIHTRDCALRLADGSFLHRGRMDHMVKIAGNRVELGEIESALRSLPGVNQAAAATYRDGSGDLRLCAFVTSQGDAVIDGGGLRVLLKRRLPAIMVPDGIVVLDHMPVLPTGKINRRGLPRYEVLPPTRETAPTDSLEEKIRSLMAEVLGVPSFTLTDNYFDFGGDSIRASRLFGELKKRLDIDAPISSLYETQTAQKLAELLRYDSEGEHNVVIPVHADGTARPLFCVHGGGGEVVWAYNFLPGLDPNLPVYGFQPSLLQMSGLVPPPASIREYAERYVGELLRIQSRGPYRLYGYSLGGQIAFDMALILQERGEQVSFLGIGDTHFGQSVATKQYVAPSLFPLRTYLGFWRYRFRDQRKWRRIFAGLANGTSVELVDRKQYFMRANRMMAKPSVSGTFRGDVTFFKSTIEDKATPPTNHVSGTVHVVPLAYRHLDFIQPGPSLEIARVIADHLRLDEVSPSAALQ